MNSRNWKIILGSRSPRRLELLKQVVPIEQIEVLPPQEIEEASFEGLATWSEVQNHLQKIARHKCDDVIQQIEEREPGNPNLDLFAVLTADTIIVANDESNNPVVLEQPPQDNSWSETVRNWFLAYYFGRTHVALSAISIAIPGRGRASRVVKTEITFHADGDRWLDWYLSTGEPKGKAGGYGIQGAASLFVSKIDGSLSNAIGLPLREMLQVFEELKIDFGHRK